MLLDALGHPLPPAPPAAPAPRPPRPGAPAAFSPWFATQHSESRKQLHTFSPDPAGQISPAARQWLDRQAQTLTANSGLASVLRTLARNIGYLKPQARTGDPAYDRLLEAAFERVATSPLIFDAAGADTFYSYQVQTTEARFVRGDLFSIFTQSPSGAARIAARGAHTVSGSPLPPGPANAWHDGVLANSDGWPLAYHFPGPLGVSGTTIDASNIFHHRNRHALGAVRGVTSLAHAINHIRDIIETTAAQKTAIKTAAEIAITRKSDTPHGTLPSSLGLGSAIEVDPYTPDYIQSGLDGENTPAPPPISFERYLESGQFSSVPLDVLHDDRPHPNALAFRESLMREIAAGIGVPHQLLYFMDDPGGAWSRVLLDIFVKFVGDQYLHHLRPFCQRFWTYCISLEIKAGRLPPPPPSITPQALWNVRWIPGRNLSADLGRMGNLTVAMRKSCLTTFATHFEELGLDWADELRQGAEEIAYLRRLESTIPDLLPGDLTGWIPPPGTAPPTAAAAAAIASEDAGLDPAATPAALTHITHMLQRLLSAHSP